MCNHFQQILEVYQWQGYCRKALADKPGFRFQGILGDLTIKGKLGHTPAHGIRGEHSERADTQRGNPHETQRWKSWELCQILMQDFLTNTVMFSRKRRGSLNPKDLYQTSLYLHTVTKSDLRKPKIQILAKDHYSPATQVWPLNQHHWNNLRVCKESEPQGPPTPSKSASAF